ncbi:hypothetical protein V6N11_007810 [Hibiscus sabdariffa]|uniref:Uncharacterized protein n=1 Tax=Hibiscus sabdariffa TaxID=183260 RepID=A0ABR1ZAZ6_9ROSI
MGLLVKPVGSTRVGSALHWSGSPVVRIRVAQMVIRPGYTKGVRWVLEMNVMVTIWALDGVAWRLKWRLGAGRWGCVDSDVGGTARVR